MLGCGKMSLRLGQATVTPDAVAAPSLASPQGPGSAAPSLASPQGPGAVVTSEIRRAADGQAYTWEQFLEYYPPIGKAVEVWNKAPEVRRAPDDMTYTMQEFIDKHGQHDGLAAFNESTPRVATEFSCAWANSYFACHFLPEQESRLSELGQEKPARSKSLRDAFQSACANAELLPLPANVFYDGDICSLLYSDRPPLRHRGAIICFLAMRCASAHGILECRRTIRAWAAKGGNSGSGWRMT